MADPTYPPGLQHQLNRIAHKYQSILVDRIRSEVDKFSATGSLKNSLKVRIIPAGNETAPEIIVEYALHGELVGKRKLLFTKQPPADDLVEWMDSSNFKPSAVPGYKGEAPNLTEEQKRERVSFAIAKDKKMNDTYKPRRWKKKALPEVLREINTEIVEAYRIEIEQEVANSLTTA